MIFLFSDLGNRKRHSIYQTLATITIVIWFIIVNRITFVTFVRGFLNSSLKSPCTPSTVSTVQLVFLDLWISTSWMGFIGYVTVNQISKINFTLRMHNFLDGIHKKIVGSTFSNADCRSTN